jgi:hypothetical protein
MNLGRLIILPIQFNPDQPIATRWPETAGIGRFSETVAALATKLASFSGKSDAPAVRIWPDLAGSARRTEVAVSAFVQFSRERPLAEIRSRPV